MIVETADYRNHKFAHCAARINYSKNGRFLTVGVRSLGFPMGFIELISDRLRLDSLSICLTGSFFVLVALGSLKKAATTCVDKNRRDRNI